MSMLFQRNRKKTKQHRVVNFDILCNFFPAKPVFLLRDSIVSTYAEA